MEQFLKRLLELQLLITTWRWSFNTFKFIYKWTEF